MKPMIVVTALLGLALAGPALGQSDSKIPSPVPSERQPVLVSPHAQLGSAGFVYIGDHAPDFVLDGSHGIPVQLSRLRGDLILLVFSDRRDQFVAMREIDSQMREIGVRIVGVCHEKARTLDTYPERESVPLMLADVSGDVAATYGLWDSASRQTIPGFFLLDRDGVVRIAFSGRRLPPDEIGRLTQIAVSTL
jgi:peroxiredoxin